MKTYTLTSLEIQGDNQSAFEVYEDETKEQTAGFVFDEKYVDFVRAVNFHEALLEALKALAKEVDLNKLNIRKDFSLINAHAYALKVIHRAEVK